MAKYYRSFTEDFNLNPGSGAEALFNSNFFDSPPLILIHSETSSLNEYLVTRSANTRGNLDYEVLITDAHRTLGLNRVLGEDLELVEHLATLLSLLRQTPDPLSIITEILVQFNRNVQSSDLISLSSSISTVLIRNRTSPDLITLVEQTLYSMAKVRGMDNLLNLQEVIIINLEHLLKAINPEVVNLGDQVLWVLGAKKQIRVKSTSPVPGGIALESSPLKQSEVVLGKNTQSGTPIKQNKVNKGLGH